MLINLSNEKVLRGVKIAAGIASMVSTLAIQQISSVELDKKVELKVKEVIEQMSLNK